ncbi:CAP domain-containing protein [Streptomyces sp. XD-27]|uniref:CAP domain-containing protein n=1 Tax=Streptomyces sp. XD-27 TaxID=3062779 RepID=UPI0026F4460B|nr:CAP domain-containing protein [Streptomyces sp. XD-27]WKX72827.1 CAP domain-containing protein [Streptomyces sp. XD-27]
MGRHRRSAPEPTAGPPSSTGTAPDATRHRGARRKGPAPVRTGLLGASAAVALGAVAVASGLVPGFSPGSGGDSGATVRADHLPDEDLGAQGSSSGPTAERGTTPASRGDGRSQAPSASPSKKASAKPSASPSKKPSPSRSAKPGGGDGTGDGRPSPTRTTAPATPTRTAPPTTGGPHSASEREVLALVNQERAQAGCSPLSADPELAELAGAFSEDMDARNFFDHTDPDGDSPWDRAKQAGVSNLGGENIARGQADARAVMDSWMNSPGHRANILNCDFKTLGVGAHEGDGGPWWTQEFGY